MVHYQDPSGQGQVVVAPVDELAFESKHHFIKVCFGG
jgi:hypothetical protein